MNYALGNQKEALEALRQVVNAVSEMESEIQQLLKERDEAIRLSEIEEVGRLRIENALRSERDEARREVCESAQYCVDRSKEEAERRGWDCYKETKP